jgi:GNAT superfamily N-acetyltransferase
MKIRRARPADVDVIAQFNRSLAWETERRRLNRAQVHRGVSALLKDSRRGSYFVAEEGREVIGQLMITREWSDWRNGDFWWIQSVYVAAAFRRSGVFRKLFGHVRGLAARTPGVCGLRLYMHTTNRRARAAYERLGMSRPHYEVFELELR